MARSEANTTRVARARASTVIPGARSILLSITLMALSASAASPGAVRAQGGDADTDSCLACHQGMADTEMSFGDGSTIPLHVDPDVWSSSVHGGQLGCVDCHREAEANFPVAWLQHNEPDRKKGAPAFYHERVGSTVNSPRY